jgi:DNA-binding phage protein
MGMKYISYDETIERARDYVKKSGGLAPVAKTLGISPQYISMMLTGAKPMGPAFLALIGVKEVKLYEIERDANAPV